MLEAPASVFLLRTDKEVQSALDGFLGLGILLPAARAVFDAGPLEARAASRTKPSTGIATCYLAATETGVIIVDQQAVARGLRLARTDGSGDLDAEAAGTGRGGELNGNTGACTPRDGTR